MEKKQLYWKNFVETTAKGESRIADFGLRISDLECTKYKVQCRIENQKFGIKNQCRLVKDFTLLIFALDKQTTLKLPVVEQMEKKYFIGRILSNLGKENCGFRTYKPSNSIYIDLNNPQSPIRNPKSILIFS
jgi:hypothetical protein